MTNAQESPTPFPKRLSTPAIGRGLGLLLFVGLLLLPVPEGLSPEAWRTAAITALMATWWVTEAIPIYGTALLPIVLFPLLGVRGITAATAPYANPVIFLFLGGFLLAVAIQRWNLHRRIALWIVRLTGVGPNSIVFGILLAAGFLSMWVSNTATAILMLPIALSLLEFVASEPPERRRNFERVLLLGIAYACNLGGIGTLIGTPPNALLAGFMQESYGYEISFFQWMTVGIPFVVVTLPVMYLVLTRILYPIRIRELPGGRDYLQQELQRLGPLSPQEKRVAVLFVLTALAWILRPVFAPALPLLSDAGIAIATGILLFLLPSGNPDHPQLLSWEDTARVPWGVLLLFGGGLSMAGSINETGLAAALGDSLAGLGALPTALLLLAVVTLMVFLTEVTSNTASTAAFLPILASLAVGIGENPLLLAAPAALAASCAFMLPVATPPNAIVYGAGRIRIPDMTRAGLLLHALFLGLLVLTGLTLIPWAFHIQLHQLPPWLP
jgi:sodium-dependent dicarboxylate transporter 2/3/5